MLSVADDGDGGGLEEPAPFLPGLGSHQHTLLNFPAVHPEPLKAGPGPVQFGGSRNTQPNREPGVLLMKVSLNADHLVNAVECEQMASDTATDIVGASPRQLRRLGGNAQVPEPLEGRGAASVGPCCCCFYPCYFPSAVLFIAPISAILFSIAFPRAWNAVAVAAFR